MSLRILLIADSKISVPPVHYGGVERIIALMAEEFRQQGHRVDLLAGPGSKAFGGTLTIHTSPTAALASRAWRKIVMQFLSLRASASADIVINFGRLDYLEAVLRTKKPLINVFQNPIGQSELDWVISRRRKRMALVGVSASQTEGLNSQSLLSYIHNATDTRRIGFQPRPDEPGYLAFLGRITANKGADMAITVAKRANMALKIAGTVSDEPGGREFFENVVKPQLKGGTEYLGPADDQQKEVLLRGARALLFPIRWPEPFGIVMAESLACGTPVIATRCASTPEVIQHGVTGFLCDNEDEMVSAVGRVDTLMRADCRRAAEERFSAQIMTNRYLEVIQRLLRA